MLPPPFPNIGFWTPTNPPRQQCHVHLQQDHPGPHYQAFAASHHNLSWWSEDWNIPVSDEKCFRMDWGRSIVNGSAALARADHHKESGFWPESNLWSFHHYRLASRTVFPALSQMHKSFTLISAHGFCAAWEILISTLWNKGAKWCTLVSLAFAGLYKVPIGPPSKLFRGSPTLLTPPQFLKANPLPCDLRRTRGDLFLMHPLLTSGQTRKYYDLCPPLTLTGHSRRVCDPRPLNLLRTNFSGLLLNRS